MRDIKNRHSRRSVQIAKKLQNFRLRNYVERAGGFIGDEQSRTMQDRHRDQNPLRLPYAHLRRELVLEFIVRRKRNAVQ